MMSAIGGFFASIIAKVVTNLSREGLKAFASWVQSKIVNLIYKIARKKNKKENDELKDKLDKSESPKEREDATNDIINNF